jgi:hypothetical protein
MSTITLKSGPLKLIFENAKAAASNKQRAQAGGKRFKPAFFVAILDDAGAVTESFSANLEAQEVILRYAPLTGGVAKLYPAAVQAMRRADVPTPGIWLETRNKLVIELTPTADEGEGT